MFHSFEKHDVSYTAASNPVRQQPQQHEKQPQQSQAQNPAQAPSAGGSGFFSALKGGAAGLMRNMKEASSKVMETVSS